MSEPKPLPYRKALLLGLCAVSIIVLIQAFLSFSCYRSTIYQFLGALMILAIPMAPALIALFSSRPLCAVGASLFFSPWLLLAYNTDCVAPKSSGGGASMIYVIVIGAGLITAAIGALITLPIANDLNGNSKSKSDKKV
jgi:hypothetical protein